MKKVIIIETDTYKKSLIDLKDPSIILRVEKKVRKLLDNPNLAVPMAKQHSGICEIKIGGKYRVYCIKKEKAIILFLLGIAMHHKKNYKKSKEYEKIFNKLREIEESSNLDKKIREIEESLKKSLC